MYGLHNTELQRVEQYAKILSMKIIKEYLKNTPKDEQERMATEAGTSVAYLGQIAGGHRTPSIGLAIKIEIASKGKLTRRDLAPKWFEELDW